EKYEDNQQKITLQGIIQVASDRMLLTVSFLSILFQILTFATVFGFTPVFALSLGASKWEMGVLTFFSTVPTALAAWYGGKFLTKRFGERQIIIAGFILSGVFTVAIPFTHSLWLLIVTQCIAGF